MKTNLSHFAINADDLDRARAFYGNAFGWRFTPWGPPGFFLIATGDAGEPGVQGALQGRRPLGSEKMNGFECSFAVQDIAATEKAVVANGGTIVMPKSTIPTVGTLFAFRDTEGNVAFAIQYDPAYARPDTKALKQGRASASR